jgi:hypothetical protein
VEGRLCNLRSSRLSRSCTNCCSSMATLLIVGAIKAGYGEAQAGVVPCVVGRRKGGRSGVLCSGGEAGNFSAREKKKVHAGISAGGMSALAFQPATLVLCRSPQNLRTAVWSWRQRERDRERELDRSRPSLTKMQRLRHWKLCGHGVGSCVSGLPQSSCPVRSTLPFHQCGRVAAGTCLLESSLSLLDMGGGQRATRPRSAATPVELSAAVFCGEQRHVGCITQWQGGNGCGG